MEMTHYMELLAQNQPRNLILFMAVPVILAEAVAISEIYILVWNTKSWVKSINKYASILWWFYFAIIFIYLLINVVLPLSSSGWWRWLADIIAIVFYLLWVIPLMSLALNHLWIYKSKKWDIKLRAFLISFFLVVAHIAMIFWMLAPSVLWYKYPTNSQSNSYISTPTMDHSMHWM